MSSTVSAESLPGAGQVDSGPPAAAKPGVVPSVWGTDWGANDNCHDGPAKTHRLSRFAIDSSQNEGCRSRFDPLRTQQR